MLQLCYTTWKDWRLQAVNLNIFSHIWHLTFLQCRHLNSSTLHIWMLCGCCIKSHSLVLIIVIKFWQKQRHFERRERILVSSVQYLKLKQASCFKSPCIENNKVNWLQSFAQQITPNWTHGSARLVVCDCTNTDRLIHLKTACTINRYKTIEQPVHWIHTHSPAYRWLIILKPETLFISTVCRVSSLQEQGLKLVKARGKFQTLHSDKHFSRTFCSHNFTTECMIIMHGTVANNPNHTKESV